MILTNSAPSTDGKHFRIYDKTSGVLQYAEKTSSGSYGGCVGLKDGRALVNTGQSGGRSYGTHIFFPKGNSWSKSTNEQNYAPNDQPNGSQIAVGADGKAYILCHNLGARISTNETKALVYCYDTKKTTAGNVSTPEWYTAVKGENKQTGYGLVVDGNGNPEGAGNPCGYHQSGSQHRSREQGWIPGSRQIREYRDCRQRVASPSGHSEGRASITVCCECLLQAGARNSFLTDFGCLSAYRSQKYAVGENSTVCVKRILFRRSDGISDSWINSVI
jgi:hypothetical protein